MKICICCSGGGHLTEVLQLRESYEKYNHFYITFKRANSVDLAKKRKVYFVQDPIRSPLNFIKCFIQSFKILLKEKPKTIISTGAGVAIPSIFLGKFLFGSRIVFIESFARINEPSWTGKLVYTIADKFYVQWKKLLKKFGEKAEYKGAVV